MDALGVMAIWCPSNPYGISLEKMSNPRGSSLDLLKEGNLSFRRWTQIRSPFANTLPSLSLFTLSAYLLPCLSMNILALSCSLSIDWALDKPSGSTLDGIEKDTNFKGGSNGAKVLNKASIEASQPMEVLQITHTRRRTIALDTTALLLLLLLLTPLVVGAISPKSSEVSNSSNHKSSDFTSDSSVFISNNGDFDSDITNSNSSFGVCISQFSLDNMVDNNRTLKELATPDAMYQPWCEDRHEGIPLLPRWSCQVSPYTTKIKGNLCVDSNYHQGLVVPTTSIV
ncbi:hypothetical protein CR513_23033, partial [Mucuna pruriens]